MNIKFRTKAKGFSLIEVMIALVILAVGILGISKLQGVLIKNSSNANQRTVAMSIAQKKIDDLKSFVHLTTVDSDVANTWTVASGATATAYAASTLSYSHINDDEGGAPVGSTDLLAGALTVGNYNYTLNWVVTDYWFDPAALTAASTVDPSAPSAYSDEKLVTITVAWNDEIGGTQNISLSTVIDAYAPALTAFSDNPASLGDNGPIVNYTPLAAPDVVPVTLDVGDQKKESSKPVPDLSKKGDSTVVTFQTVTYSPIALSSVTTTERREEFLTAVCNCKSGGATPTTSIIKGFLEWDVEDLVLRDVASVVAVSPSIIKAAVDNGGGEDQHAACTACCRDEADGATGFKTCRMKRVDGIYRLFEPWKMIAFNIIPASYFNKATGASGATSSNSIPYMTSTIQASNIGLYSEYVKSVVRDALQNGISTVPNSSFKTFSTVSNFVNGASTIHTQFSQGEANYRELQARAVYLDIPPNEIYDGGNYTPTGVSAVPLDRVPFYENNFTQIAGWIPDVNLGENTSSDGDLTWVTDYTAVHDYMNSSCENPRHNTSAERTALNRNHVTNEKFFYPGGGTTTTCLNSSRGAFYPIRITSGVVPTNNPITGTINSRMYTSNDGVIDRLVNTGVSSANASIELTVIP
ncbi:MAG: prepilin-type N-terminal cleavage/methylation domain-containing protein [Piscirickettsiaceae bacterium]|nr:prepilin-type N-terminal cleavage/methylation domain-containing protein [Piscirickettsiaceae bacterium]